MRTLLTAFHRHAEVARRRLAPLLLDKPRVAYVGGHGDRNLGDDALFEAAVQLLPGFHLEPFRFPSQERRLALLGLSGARYFHQFVLGGGTFINPYGAITVRAALRQGLLAWTLGTGVGSAGFNMSRRLDLSEWRPMLRDFHALGVRGPLSQALLDELGVHHAQVVGDLALALTRPAVTPPAEPRRFAVNITLSPPHEPEGYGYERLEGLERALRELLGRGWEPVFIAMHRNDFEPVRRLMAAVGRSEDRLHHPHTAEQYLRLVEPCTLALAVRLHAAVLACCAGVPPLMLGYRDKCLDFMASMGLERWHVDLLSSEEAILPRALELAEAADGLRAPVLEQARHYQRTLHAYVQRLAS
jgi:polysaccharide pyruvyl transferase WcaK-like protein